MLKHAGTRSFSPVFSAVRSYFSFTKSSTKIAQIPTVIGNCETIAFCSGVPCGRVSVNADMANAVRMPRCP